MRNRTFIGLVGYGNTGKDSLAAMLQTQRKAPSNTTQPVMPDQKITEGQCRCGIKINRIENCPFFMLKDGVRYDYANHMTKNVNIFRCKGCEKVIFDTWRPLKTKAPAKAKQAPPENIRQGAPYDNPAFEKLARDLGVWGTAQSALCAQFWLTALANNLPAKISIHTVIANCQQIGKS